MTNTVIAESFHYNINGVSVPQMICGGSFWKTQDNLITDGKDHFVYNNETPEDPFHNQMRAGCRQVRSDGSIVSIDLPGMWKKSIACVMDGSFCRGTIAGRINSNTGVVTNMGNCLEFVRVVDRIYNIDGSVFWERKVQDQDFCSLCGGTGNGYNRFPCEKCNGTGYIRS